MALPTYATAGQRVGYYSFLTYCGFVFFFLIAPIFIILPLSFSASPFFEFTREFMRLEPEAYSLRWYKQMVGISSIGDTTVVTNKWMLGTRNSFFIGISATLLATSLGTVAALGLSRPSMPFKGTLMAILISPMIVPLIITSAGMFFFYSKIGLSGVIGGVSLGSAMMCFIWSITHTSAAVTLLMLAAMPFITAILGYFILKEKISITTFTAIIIAAIGIFFMASNSNKIGTLFGLLVGLMSALGFSIFSVSLRWRKNTPTFTTVAVAGLFCGVFSFFVLIFSDANFFTTFRNSSLSALHGTLVCSGMILYSLGSKHLPAAELTLLSLTEVLAGIFWVWLPVFGINEVPSTNTIIGGSIITFAILYYSLNTKRNRRFIGLN